MKNILVIDGAENCAYDCFEVDENLFAALFPDEGQDIEFIEDFFERESDDRFEASFKTMWTRRIPRKQVSGIDGVLFYELLHKKIFYPNKKDSDLDGTGRPSHI